MQILEFCTLNEFAQHYRYNWHNQSTFTLDKQLPKTNVKLVIYCVSLQTNNDNETCLDLEQRLQEFGCIAEVFGENCPKALVFTHLDKCAQAVRVGGKYFSTDVPAHEHSYKTAKLLLKYQQTHSKSATPDTELLHSPELSHCGFYVPILQQYQVALKNATTMPTLPVDCLFFEFQQEQLCKNDHTPTANIQANLLTLSHQQLDKVLLQTFSDFHAGVLLR